jgi:hypothetical protein
MNPAITITEVHTDNQENKRIIISGAENHDDARNAAEEWCEEHNTRILDFINDPKSVGQGASQIYYAVFGTDEDKLQEKTL